MRRDPGQPGRRRTGGQRANRRSRREVEMHDAFGGIDVLGDFDDSRDRVPGAGEHGNESVDGIDCLR